MMFEDMSKSCSQWHVRSKGERTSLVDGDHLGKRKSSLNSDGQFWVVEARREAVEMRSQVLHVAVISEVGRHGAEIL